MSEFISKRIIKEAEKDVELGKSKFAAYFIRTKLYESYRESVEEILTKEGYADCIVTE